LISFEIQLIPLLSILAIARMLFLLFKNLSIFFRSPKHKCIYVLIFIILECSASKVNLQVRTIKLYLLILTFPVFFVHIPCLQKTPRAFLPRPPLRAKTQNEIPPNFKNINFNFAYPLPRKLL